MSELTTRTVVELEQLGLYHKLNKAYIDAGLEKKWESATFDEVTRKVSFFTVPQPSGNIEPAFTFTLPEVDFTEVYSKISEVEVKVKENETKITTLIGNDAGKSARQIANEELAKQLIPENASESLDTLEEIASWIQSHPNDASALNKAITDLENLVGTLPGGITSDNVVDYIEEVKTSILTQLNSKIADLDADVSSATVETGKGVQVQVVETDGKVTAVNVTGNYDNSYDAKGSANAAKTDALAAVTALENGAVADAQSDATAALEQIAAIKYASEEDVRALWINTLLNSH